MNAAAQKLPWYIWAPLLVVLAVSAFDIIAVWPGNARETIITFSGPTMGTRYSVTLAEGVSENLDVVGLQRRVEERLAQINRLMSTYEPASELSRFNRYDRDDWFPVSLETAGVAAAALGIAERSAGAFDPTIGPVVNLWGFGPQKGRTEPPDDQQIAAALASVGYRNVTVRRDPPALRKSQPEVQLDLSGIAKGYAADAVSRLLADLGCGNSLVAIGGEVYARGRNMEGEPWRVGVERGPGEVVARVNLVDAAISTSGDFHNHFEHEGVRYSHTIDPTTGWPVRHETAAVSIIAANSMAADGLATAALVMGYPRGFEWCEEHNVPAIFQVREGDRIVTRATPSFEKLLP